jgi:glutamate 5-kinase
MTSRPPRIVIKLGSGLLANLRGDALDDAQFDRLTSEIAALSAAGNECLLVSSGAVSAGMMTMGLTERPKDLPIVQACAAIGQSRLMHRYETLFARHQLAVAQILLTHQDLDSRTRHANARNTFNRLLEHRGIVPIINENDVVAVEELRFGDNDRLSAEVAMLVAADLLILLTSAEGLTHEHDGRGVPIPLVEDVDAVVHLASAHRGRFSMGGMGSKLQAVKIAVDAGIQTVIANGRTPGLLERIVAGESVGTRFTAKAK